MSGHELAEARSLALHAAIADRLREDPALVEAARARVAGWPSAGVSAYYANEWAKLLDEPLAALCSALVDPGEYMTALRQVTPFAGVVPPAARWAIWRRVREARGDS